MSSYNDIREQEIAHFTNSLAYREEERESEAVIVSNALNTLECQQRVSTAAFVSHYDKTSSDKCLDTTSSTTCGRGSMRDFQFIKHRPWSESSSSTMYGKGNNREGSSRNLARSFTRYSVIYRPSFRLWKKCSATCARTVTSVSDSYEMAEQNYFHKDRSVYSGHQQIQQRRTAESHDLGSMKKTDSCYSIKHRDNWSNLPVLSSLTEYNLNNNIDRSHVHLPCQGHSMGASNLNENEQSLLEKSAAICRATNAAFEAILPYISFEEAQSLRDIITNQSPSVALNAVMQVAQSCKKTADRSRTSHSNEKGSLHKVDKTWELSHTGLDRSKNWSKLREQDAWFTDFSISQSSASEVPVGSPSGSSSIGSSASGPVEPLATTSAWVSPFLLNRGLEQANEPWDIEHCASEMEELDLLVSENVTDEDSPNEHHKGVGHFQESDVSCRSDHDDMRNGHGISH
ncbi:hypothetical protein Gasu2_63450 [Galdieria sulphuraria]|nr:hypothetical protein Gasu2_63450 [Galdieria sulphuraria]